MLSNTICDLIVCPGSSELVEKPAEGTAASEGLAALTLDDPSPGQGTDEFHDATDGGEDAASDPSAAAASFSSPASSSPPPAMVWRGVDPEFGAVRAVYHCNRAACLQQLGRDDDAIVACSTAVALHPAYVKAYMRRGQAFEGLARFGDAIGDMDAVLKLEPTSRCDDATAALARGSPGEDATTARQTSHLKLVRNCWKVLPGRSLVSWLYASFSRSF